MFRISGKLHSAFREKAGQIFQAFRERQETWEREQLTIIRSGAVGKAARQPLPENNHHGNLLFSKTDIITSGSNLQERIVNNQ